MIISCTTAMRCIFGQESSMTNFGDTEPTPYLHPPLSNDPKEKKPRYHQQGKKL